MKLLGFLVVFLGSILACSAAALDTSDAPTNLVERGDVRCKKSDECHRWGMWCVKGVCRHLNHPFPPRDESSAEPMLGLGELEGRKCDSDKNCPKSKKCIGGQCRNGPNVVSAGPETPPNPEGSDVKIWCQKDSDCGNGMCLENACVDATTNDGDDDSDDDDKEMHIEARRQKCKEDKDCPKGKSCMWNACRAPVTLHSRRDDLGNLVGIIADPNDNDIGIDDPIMHTMNSELYSDAANDIEAHDLESLKRKRCKGCRERDQLCSNGRCVNAKRCGDGPPCNIGWCKNGHCTSSIARRSTDVAAQDGDEPYLAYDNLVINNNADANDDVEKPETHDLESRGRKKCKNCRPGQICRRGHCIDRKCGDGPPCTIGLCKDGHCTGIARRSTDVDAQGGDEPYLAYDNLVINDNADANDDIEKPETQDLERRESQKCSNCYPGQTCRKGKCIDEKCGGGPSCKVGKCRKGKCTSVSRRSDDDEPGLPYDNLADNDNTDDDDDDANAESLEARAVAKDCKTFKDCEAGEACKRKKCTPYKCSDPGRCRSGICKGGKCTRSLGFRTTDLEEPDEFADVLMCKTTDDCTSGDCQNGLCFSGPETFERRGKYPPRCQSANDCPPQNRCYGGICKYRPHKRDESSEETELEVLAGKYPPRCKSANDCPPKNRCYGGICKYRGPEKRDEDISEPELEVLAGKYPPRCKSATDCPPNNRCYGGICKYRPPEKRDDEDISEAELEARSPKPPQRCNNNDDCDHWLQCHKGICKFRPPRYDGRPN